MRNKLLIVVTQGFSFRMIIQSGLLQEMSELYDITLVIPKSINEISETVNIKKITIIEYHHRSKLTERILYPFRKYIVDDVRGNVGLYEKHKRRWKSKKSLLTLIYCTVSELLMAFRCKLVSSLYIRIEPYFFRNKTVREILIKNNPDVVVVTYPVMFPEPQFLLEARKLKIKTVSHLLSWDNLLAKGRFIGLPDYWISWGPIMASEIMDLYKVSRDSIYFGGVPHFKSHYSAKKLEKRRSIFFGMSASIYAPNEIDIVEFIHTKISDGTIPNDIQFVVRPHPQNISGNLSNKSWLKRLKRLEERGVLILWPRLKEKSSVLWEMEKSEIKILSEYLSTSLVSLNSGSTLTIESAIVNTPVIITSFDGDEVLPYWRSARRLVDYPHLAKLISFGIVGSVNNYSNLMVALMKALTESDSDPCDLELLSNMYVYQGEHSIMNSIEAYKSIVDD